MTKDSDPGDFDASFRGRHRNDYQFNQLLKRIEQAEHNVIQEVRGEIASVAIKEIAAMRELVDVAIDEVKSLKVEIDIERTRQQSLMHPTVTGLLAYWREVFLGKCGSKT